MLIIALVLAVIGLAALVFAVVTSNELVAWVCIAASVLGVALLIIDALQERQRRQAGASASADEEPPRHAEPTDAADSGADETFDAEYPEDVAGEDAETGVDAASSPPPESGKLPDDKP
jgi:hypothetical protein